MGLLVIKGWFTITVAHTAAGWLCCMWHCPRAPEPSETGCKRTGSCHMGFQEAALYKAHLEERKTA
jgi:hypothetical protein